MNDLQCNVRREVLNSTYPALYVVFFSILEGNTRQVFITFSGPERVSDLFMQNSKIYHILKGEDMAGPALQDPADHCRESLQAGCRY